jgi:lysophospholipase L1-like esterase
MHAWRRILIACAAVAGATLYIPATALGAHYYLALGDSLAQGWQAPPTRPNAGYVDDLFARRRAQRHDLRLITIACLGATSATLISGDLCTGPAGPQLGRAVAFLRAHRRAIDLVTIDIGGNDIGAACGTGTSVTLPCVRSALARTRTNVTTIASALRAAAGPKATIVAMNYYDPGLAWWLQGGAMRALVPETLQVVDLLNRTIAAGYAAGSIPVADVATAFASHDLTHTTALAGYGRVPVAVANICRYTGNCRQPQNPHANPAGYRVIANAFIKKLRPGR